MVRTTNARLQKTKFDMTHQTVIYSYGLFMVAWSVLESVIQAEIMKQLKVNEHKAVLVTSKLQFYPRMELLCGLLELHGDTHKETISLLRKIEGFAERNTLVHGLIVVGCRAN